jgi:hypothetical protein
MAAGAFEFTAVGVDSSSNPWVITAPTAGYACTWVIKSTCGAPVFRWNSYPLQGYKADTMIGGAPQTYSTSGSAD